MRNPRFLGFVAAAAVALTIGCKGGASEKEIERWKASNATSQLSGALTSPKSQPNVRLRAARALVELGADAHFADGMKKLTAEARAAVAAGLVGELEALLKSPEPAKQILGKDFLGLIVLAGDEATAKSAGPALMAWLGVDLGKRTAMGKVSGIEIARKLGAPALPALLAAFKPNVDPVLLAKIIAGIGDAVGVAHAADQVTALARAQGPKVPERTFKALFTLGGPRAATQLAALAADPKLSFPSRRSAAEEMRALAHPAALEPAAKLALDSDGDQLVRESALVYVEKVCDAKQCARYLEGVWSAMKNRSLVFEAASAIVKIGGAQKLGELLAEMPRGRGYTAKGIEGIAEDIQKNVGKGAIAALRKAVKDAPAPGKLVAIRALARLGGVAEAKLLDGLTDDDSVPDGWRAKTKVGEEAKKAAAEIRARK